MPPPPPPPPGPPPLSGGNLFASSNSSDGRNQLLDSIRKGTKLKKAVTVDKSAPLISGKIANTSNGNNSIINDNKIGQQRKMPTSGGNGLIGDLFAGGMPKLRPTGRNLSKHSETDDKKINESKSSNMNQLNDLLKRQMHDSKSSKSNFGQNKSNNINDTRPHRMNLNSNDNTDSSSIINHSVDNLKSPISVSLQPNKSSLHNNVNNHVRSNSELSQKSVISHGKPNLAPKPPNFQPAGPQSPHKKPSPPPKNLTLNRRSSSGNSLFSSHITRAQSMRVRSSPPVTPTSPLSSPGLVNGMAQLSLARLTSEIQNEFSTEKNSHQQNSANNQQTIGQRNVQLMRQQLLNNSNLSFLNNSSQSLNVSPQIHRPTCPPPSIPINKPQSSPNLNKPKTAQQQSPKAPQKLTPPKSQPPATPMRTGSTLSFTNFHVPPPPPTSPPPAPPSNRMAPSFPPPPPPPNKTQQINSNNSNTPLAGSVNGSSNSTSPQLPSGRLPNGAPMPPIRGASMRSQTQTISLTAAQSSLLMSMTTSSSISMQIDVDKRFGHLFHNVNDFPPPDDFKNIQKLYSNNRSTGGGKQQAPLPPTTTIQLGNKMWPSNQNQSTC